MATGTKRAGLPYLLTGGAVVDVFFSGFINLLPVTVGGLYPATIVLDLLVLAMLLGIVGRFLNGNDYAPAWVGGMIVLAGLHIGLFMYSAEALPDKILALRSAVLYGFTAIYVYWRVPPEDLRRLYRLMVRCAVILAVVGILQFLLRNSLPTWLLVSRDTYVFTYYGTDLVRATGLVGNTIVYATLMLLFYCLRVTALVRDEEVRASLLQTFVLGVAVLCSFSRVAIAGAALVTVAAGLYWLGKALLNRVDVLFGVATIGVAAATWATVSGAWQSLTRSFLFSGLFSGENASVQGSNSGHSADAQAGLDAFREHPFVGVGIGTQTQGSAYSVHTLAISDGAFWATLAEGGLLLVAGYAIVLALGLRYVTGHLADVSARAIRVGLVLFVGYEVCFAIFLNSGILGKAPFVVSWMLFGIVAGLRRSGDRELQKRAGDVGRADRRAKVHVAAAPPLSGSGQCP